MKTFAINSQPINDNVTAMKELTPKEVQFTLAYVETGSAAKAYRRAYDHNGTDATARRAAYDVLHRPRVTHEIARLQEAHQIRHGITVDLLTDELETARLCAMDRGQVAAAVTAIMGKAKLHGLLVDRKEIGQSPEIRFQMLMSGASAEPGNQETDHLVARTTVFEGM